MMSCNDVRFGKSYARSGLIETEEDQEFASFEQLMWTELVASGRDVEEFDVPLFGRLQFIELADGEYGVFNCEGTLTLLASFDAAGDLVVRPAGAAAPHIADYWMQYVGFAATLEPQ